MTMYKPEQKSQLTNSKFTITDLEKKKGDKERLTTRF